MLETPIGHIVGALTRPTKGLRANRDRSAQCVDIDMLKNSSPSLRKRHLSKVVNLLASEVGVRAASVSRNHIAVERAVWGWLCLGIENNRVIRDGSTISINLLELDAPSSSQKPKLAIGEFLLAASRECSQEDNEQSDFHAAKHTPAAISAVGSAK